MMAEAQIVNYRNLTAAELRSVTDSLRMIANQSRLKNRLLTARDKRSLDEAVTDFVASIKKHSTGRNKPEFGSTRSPWQDTKRGAAAFKDVAKNPMAILHTLDGFEQDGIAWKLIGRPQQEAAAQESEQMNLANENLKEIYDRYSARDLRQMN
jgi:hypothetical protein